MDFISKQQRRFFLSSLAICLLSSGCNEAKEQEAITQMAPDPEISGATRSALSSDAHNEEILAADDSPYPPQPHIAGTSAMQERPPAYLPTESAFLAHQGTSVSQEAVASALKSKDFDDLMLAMSSDMGGDSAAQDLTRIYRTAIERELGPGARLTSFACGTTLCAGSIHARGTNDAFSEWERNFGTTNGVPAYVLMTMVFDRGENYFENRFFFSTDPAANSVNVPAGSAPARG